MNIGFREVVQVSGIKFVAKKIGVFIDQTLLTTICLIEKLFLCLSLRFKITY